MCLDTLHIESASRTAQRTRLKNQLEVRNRGAVQGIIGGLGIAPGRGHPERHGSSRESHTTTLGPQDAATAGSGEQQSGAGTNAACTGFRVTTRCGYE
ncbi:hypothetical protein ANCDUO_26397, partial [Ancylostoma duodenale]